MAKRTTKIMVDGERLRELLALRESRLETVAEKAGCSRQTLHTWLSTNRIPPRRLSVLVKEFGLTATELGAIRPKQELNILFRTLRDVRVPEETASSVAAKANEIVKLHLKESFVRAPKPLPVHKGKSVKEMAKFIRKTLQLPDVGITLEQLLSSLETQGVPVIFFNFGEELREAKICAFTARLKATNIIFIDSECPLEDVAWRIFHELTHIFSDDGKEVSVQQEKFCDAVASELLTPASFFEDNFSELKTAFSAKKMWRLPAITREISDYLGGSFLGVILSLQQNKVISRGSSAQRYLMKVHSNTKDERETVESLILPEGDENSFSHWANVFSDRTKVRFLRYQQLIRDGLLSELVSLERAAEIFDVDIITMQQLRAAWIGLSEDVESTAD